MSAGGARLHEEVDAARARDALGPRDPPLRTWRCAAAPAPDAADGCPPCAGRLFASASLAAFHAPPAPPIRLPLADLARLELDGAGVLLATRDERLCLSGFEAPADVIAELEELRVRAVEALMQRLAAASRSSGSGLVLIPPAPPPAPSAPPSVAALYAPLYSLPLPAAAAARRLSVEVRAPLSACLVLHALPARSVLRAALVDGTLYVSAALLAFVSPAARASLAVPLAAITLPLAVDAAGEALRFSVAARSVELWVGAARLEALATELDRLVRHAQLAAPAPRRLSALAAPPGVACVRAVPRDDATEGVKREAWRTYFAKHGAPEAAVVRTAELPALVRAFSIPDELRPALWWHLSGASLLVATHSVQYDPRVPCPRRAADEIERDLRRTLPDHPHFQRDEGLGQLRRVLTAYAARNPALGYCQSMNFVAALLLLFLAEERAFAVLCLVCERFLPAYYTPDMGGSLLDQRVFEELVAERLPRLHAHFTACGLPIPLLTLSWFLCLYSQILPLDGSLHLLDIFLTEGAATVLFELGLAMLALNEAALLALPDPELLTDQLRRTDLAALFARVLDPAHALPAALLHERRARHRRLLVRHLRDESRARDRRRLKRESAAAALAASGPASREESPLGSPVAPAPDRYSPGLLDAIATVRSSLAPGGSPAAHSPAVPLLLRDPADAANAAATAAAASTSLTEAGSPPYAALALGGERLQALQRYVELGLLSVLREPKLLERGEQEPEADADNDKTKGAERGRDAAIIPRLRSTSSPIRVPSSVLLLASDADAAESPVARVQTEEIFSISL